VHWDVSNEMLHFDFYENRLGGNATADFFSTAKRADPLATLFLNDFNVVEAFDDLSSSADSYVSRLRQLADAGVTFEGIGLEGHFGKPNIPYVRAVLDKLGTLRLPIWLTEIDVAPGPNQAQYLEQILREVYAHPAVHGIILWTARHPQGCYVMCLTDSNFRNLPTGDVVDKLIAEWKTHSHAGVADADGYYEAELFHGDYKVTVSHPVANSTVVQSLSVDRETDTDSEYTIHV